jgi:ABC-2 type transport system permease protein
MRTSLAIFKKELRSYFVSPIAYVVLAVFLGLAGYFFYSQLATFIRASLYYTSQAMQYRMSLPPMNMNEWVIRPFFYNLSIITIFLIPMITMRLIAEEKKSGTIELLLTSPVTDFQFTMGKFLAGFALYAIMVGSTVFHFFIMFKFGKPDVGPVLAGYLGLLLSGAALIAIGLLISSSTENQIVAAAVSFGVFLLLWIIGWAADFAGPFLGRVLDYLSITSHFDDFSKGVIDSRDTIFYLSLAVGGLLLTVRSVEARKWRG